MNSSPWLVFFSFFLLPLLEVSTAWSGSIAFSPTKTQVIQNTQCKETDSCDLEYLKIETKEFRAVLPNDPTAKNNSFGTSAFFYMKTKKVEDLKKYVFVQFIRGCHFKSQMVKRSQDEISSVKKEIYILREHFGKDVLFQHPTWVVDSLDEDPVYQNPIQSPSSSKTIPRNGMYRFIPRSAPSLSEEYEIPVYRKTPDAPLVYATDIPGSAWMLNGEAKNLSFQFKMCIYRESEVPKISTPENMDLGTALICGNWASSYIYDFEKNKFQHPDSIDPICLETPSAKMPFDR